MANQPEPGAGDVQIMLDGKEYTLTPSLSACLAISRSQGGGGALNIVDKLARFDFDSIQFVIEQGLGRSAKELPELIYRTGVNKLAAPCIRFVNHINNGGRPAVEEDSNDDGPLDPPNA